MKNILFCFRVPADYLTRIPPILRGGENKPEFIRDAVRRELERREAIIAERGAVETFEDQRRVR